MNENELKQSVARNIATLRKSRDMTQAELAEKLCYSDKSISKWERGDGLPDVYVLTQIASLFGVTVDDIISERAVAELGRVDAAANINRSRHILITALSTGLVWFAATLVFFFLKIFMTESPWLWMAFVFALPVSSIVVVVFSHMWWGVIMQGTSVSALVWSLTVCLHLAALVPNVKNMNFIYAVSGVFQVLVILWYLYQMTKKNKQTTERRNIKSNAEDSYREENENG